MLTPGEETAALSGLLMARLRAAAVAGAALLTGAPPVALAGVIGFKGLAAPHLVRGSVSDDPGQHACCPRPWPVPCCWSPLTSPPG